MSGKIYLRPLGFLFGKCADAAVRAGDALWLAGGPLAFSIVEVIEGPADRATRKICSTNSLLNSGDLDLGTLLKRISGSRQSISGLSMDRTHLMGIVNVTPDSFSDGGSFGSSDDAVNHGLQLQKDGASILDIGGESTRPDAEFVPIDVERQRVLPVIEGLRIKTRACLSVDTRKSKIMLAAAEAGADLLNDVSAFTFDSDSPTVVGSKGLPVVLMHAQGDPKTMQVSPHYENVLLDVFDFLEERIDFAVQAGISRTLLIADPGIGFGKTLDHNLELLSGLSLFHSLGVPLLLGASRKRFIGALANEPSAERREPGSYAAALAGAAQGVQILRVHDVAGTNQALRVWQACRQGSI